MDVPVYIVEEFKCGQCGMYLSRGPVFQQHDGAATCSRCFSPERPATRNKQYETAAKLLKFDFPCKYQDLGCRETVLFRDEEEDGAHEAECEYRQYVCPVLGSSRCDWLGSRSQIWQHCRMQHPGHELLDTCRRCGDVTVEVYNRWRCERCPPAKRACKNQAQGCTYQDIPDKCIKHEDYFCQQSTKCYICCEDIPRGTLASHYASAHRDKTYGAGATWQATYTCKYRCEEVLCLMTAGTAVCRYWLCDESDDYCNYDNKPMFVLEVLIPVSSERLREFCCEVRVTQLTTGLTRTYTPNISYSKQCDWHIYINEADFPDWSWAFDVCVNITNI